MHYLNSNDQFVDEFVARTRKIIAQYEGVQGEHYESTLLANCLLGLLVFPEEKYFSQLRDDLLSAEYLTDLSEAVKRSPRKSLDLRYILRHMRNAAAHGHICFSSASTYTTDTEIKNIVFFDDADWKAKRKLNDYEFCLDIEIKKLRLILADFCDNVLKTENLSGKVK